MRARSEGLLEAIWDCLSQSSLYILGTCPSLFLCIPSIFSSSAARLVSPLVISFDEQKAFYFNVTQFMASAFCVLFKESLTTPKVMKMSFYAIFQNRLANFYCKGTDSKYFRYCGPATVATTQCHHYRVRATAYTVWMNGHGLFQ